MQRDATGLWTGYINGQSRGTSQGTVVTLGGATGGLYIGSFSSYNPATTKMNTTTLGISGYMDDFRVTPAQVYQGNFTPSATALPAADIPVYTSVSNNIYGIKVAS